MRVHALAFFAAYAFALAADAHAVPGPLVSWGMGIISNAGALFAVFFGFLAMAAASASIQLRAFRHLRPKTFFSVVVVLVAGIAGGIGYFAYGGSGNPVRDPLDALRAELSKRAEANAENDASVPLAALMESLETAPPAQKFSDPALEEEIAYSIWRNNNVVWNRYLSAGKVPTDGKTLEDIRNGLYEIPLEKLLPNGKLDPSYEIVDLRTELEFRTSAHFHTAKNVEYRAIVNDEATFDKAKTYVIVCHDGAADLSRSLIAASYLRSKGYRAYALSTGMRPILDRMGIAPAAFSKKTRYATFRPESGPKPETVLVDTLGALGKTLAERGYPAGYRIIDFPFYRMGNAEYRAASASLEKVYAEPGAEVSFACYDTFSCFYARIFTESAENEKKPGIAIFR